MLKNELLYQNKHKFMDAVTETLVLGIYHTAYGKGDTAMDTITFETKAISAYQNNPKFHALISSLVANINCKFDESFI